MRHTIDGKGGKSEPDLTDVGARRDSEWLMNFLRDPKSMVPRAKMLPVKATDEELSALADYLSSLK